MLSIVRQQRDAMLTNNFVGSIESYLLNMNLAEPHTVHSALLTISDLNSFSEALQALDDYTYLTVRWFSPLSYQTGDQIGESVCFKFSWLWLSCTLDLLCPDFALIHTRLITLVKTLLASSDLIQCHIAVHCHWLLIQSTEPQQNVLIQRTHFLDEFFKRIE